MSFAGLHACASRSLSLPRPDRAEFHPIEASETFSFLVDRRAARRTDGRIEGKKCSATRPIKTRLFDPTARVKYRRDD